MPGTDNLNFDEMKARVWQALEQKLPVPDLANLYGRPISKLDVYFLLRRFAPLQIYNALSLGQSAPMTLLNLPDASPHFDVYDCGNCLKSRPKDLFSADRTEADMIQTARAVTNEAYRRGWRVIEVVGFEIMMRAAWVRTQHLEDELGEKIEILHSDPTLSDLRIYADEAKAYAQRRFNQEQP